MKNRFIAMVILGVAVGCARSDPKGSSLDLARSEIERLVGSSTPIQRRFVWRITHCDPAGVAGTGEAINYASLSEDEKRLFGRHAKGKSFFIHRFIPRSSAEARYVIVVSGDGQTLLGTFPEEPNKAPEPTR